MVLPNALWVGTMSTRQHKVALVQTIRAFVLRNNGRQLSFSLSGMLEFCNLLLQLHNLLAPFHIGREIKVPLLCKRLELLLLLLAFPFLALTLQGLLALV